MVAGEDFERNCNVTTSHRCVKALRGGNHLLIQFFRSESLQGFPLSSRFPYVFFSIFVLVSLFFASDALCVIIYLLIVIWIMYSIFIGFCAVFVCVCCLPLLSFVGFITMYLFYCRSHVCRGYQRKESLLYTIHCYFSALMLLVEFHKKRV